MFFRKNLNFFEIASAMSALVELYGMTQEELALKMSITQPAVANKLRLLRFSEVERKVMLDNGLTERHARSFLRIKDSGLRMSVLERVVLGGLNVKQTEKMVEKVLREYENGEISDGSGVKVEKNTGFVEVCCSDVIQKAVEKLRNSGFEAKSVCTETDGYYICTITVGKV